MKTNQNLENTELAPVLPQHRVQATAGMNHVKAVTVAPIKVLTHSQAMQTVSIKQ